MEAVSLLSPGRGMRRAPYGDLIKAGSEPGIRFQHLRPP
jgi:DNA replication and repair protein RecF